MKKKLSQKLCIIDFLCIFASLLFLGVLAHLARALDWQSKVASSSLACSTFLMIK